MARSNFPVRPGTVSKAASIFVELPEPRLLDRSNLDAVGVTGPGSISMFDAVMGSGTLSIKSFERGGGSVTLSLSTFEKAVVTRTAAFSKLEMQPVFRAVWASKFEPDDVNDLSPVSRSALARAVWAADWGWRYMDATREQRRRAAALQDAGARPTS